MKANVSGVSLNRKCIAGLVLATILAAGPISRVWAGDLAIHGFGTLGVSYIDKPAGWTYSRSLNARANDHSGRADLDSVVGLQLNYQHTAHLEFVGQATARRLDSDAKASNYLDLAFASWSERELERAARTRQS